MIDIACRPPAENQQAIIQSGLTRMGYTPSADTTLNAFGISLGQDMAVVPGRILPPPQIKYSNQNARILDSAWNMKDVKFVVPAPLRNCAALALRAGGRDDFTGSDDPEFRRVSPFQ